MLRIDGQADRWMDARTHGQPENSIPHPPTNKVGRGIIKKSLLHDNRTQTFKYFPSG